MEEQSVRRRQSRVYFHNGRNPETLLLMSGKAYVGIVLDHSLTGIGVEIRSPVVSLFPGEKVDEIYVGKTDPGNRIGALEVMHVTQDKERGVHYVGLHARETEDQKRLQQIFASLRNIPPEDVSGQKFRRDRIPMPQGQNPHSAEAARSRLEWTEIHAGATLEHLEKHSYNPMSLAGNIENFIGAVQIPVGVAGPVLVNGMYTDGYVPVPIATTEGALVASITRGARVCALAGGIKTYVIEQVMHRAPIFFCRDLDGAINLRRWVEKNKLAITAKAESVSTVAKISQIETFLHGKTLHITFSYTTGDAAGQNMTTACTWYACEWICSELKGDEAVALEGYAIEGNHSGDKKANTGNFTRGRGISVYAEVFINNNILERFLRVNSKTIATIWESVEVAAMRLGMTGCNINFANVIAGIFTAAGQDIACVHESSMGILKIRDEGEGARISAYLPSLVIGTIGGGTGLPTQREALQMMNCYGAGNVFRLAEIIAASCLALDVSTGAAIGSNEFVHAHERLGRNRPTRYLARSEINSDFFTNLLHDKSQKVSEVQQVKLDASHGIASSILSNKRSGVSGIFRYSLMLQSKAQGAGESESPRQLDCILKLKSSCEEMVNIGLGVAKLSGDDVIPGLFDANRTIFGFEFGDVREIELMRNIPEAMRPWCPAIYGSCVEPDRALFAILMEDLKGTELMDSVNTPERWTDAHIEAALTGLAEVHAVHLGRKERIPQSAHVRDDDCAELVTAKDFLQKLTEFNASKKDAAFSPRLAQRMQTFLGSLENHVATMAAAPSTLTHNDCNPRNLTMRRHPDGRLSPVFFDWELATWQNPQRDVAELLSFLVAPQRPAQDFIRFTQHYCRELKRMAPESFSSEREFLRLLELNLLKFTTVRLNLYALVATLSGFTFLNRVGSNVERFLDELEASLPR